MCVFLLLLLLLLYLLIVCCCCLLFSAWATTPFDPFDPLGPFVSQMRNFLFNAPRQTAPAWSLRSTLRRRRRLRAARLHFGFQWAFSNCKCTNVDLCMCMCVCEREREYTCVCINWCMFDVTLLALPASLSLALSPFSAWVDGDCAARVCRIVLHSSLRATFAQAIHTLTLSHSHRHSSTHMHTLTHSGNSAREKLLFVLCKWLRRRQRPAEQFRRRRRHLCRTLPLLVWYFPSRFIFGTQLKPKVWKARMSEQLSLLLLWFLVAVGIRLRLALHWVKVSKRIRFAFANAIASARGREREWQIEIK